MLNCSVCHRKRGNCYWGLYLSGQVRNHTNTHIVGEHYVKV